MLTTWVYARNQGQDTRLQDMRLLVSPRHFRSLLIVPLLVGILAFPASAQIISGSNDTGTAGAQAQSELTGEPTSSNPAAPKTGSNSATPSTQTDATAGKTESEPGVSQPESSPGPKKSGPAILISINKAKQKMTVVVWDNSPMPALSIPTDPEVATDGRQATHGGDVRARCRDPNGVLRQQCFCNVRFRVQSGRCHYLWAELSNFCISRQT
jgi:cytoskeletal protein RodZ